MTEVGIGLEYEHGVDILIVHLNGVKLVEGLDFEYVAEGNKIIKIDASEPWNLYGVDGQLFVIDVLRNVGEKVEMDDLADDVKQAIEAAGNIDLSGKQDTTDNNLATTDKTIVGAINELFQNANNGKQIIADAIGSPLSSDDTFAAMGSSINTLTTNFRNALALKGVNAPADKFETLISKIDEIVQSGNVLNNQVMISGEYNVVTATTDLTVEINLNFDPEYFIVYIPKIESTSTNYHLQWNSNICLTTDDPSVSAVYNSYTGSDWNYSSSNWTLTYNRDSFNVKGSYITRISANTVVKWYAIGSSQLPNNGGERTITPSTSDQVLPDGYYSGNITVKGDSDLKPENIVEGVEIFGVTGNVKGSIYPDWYVETKNKWIKGKALPTARNNMASARIGSKIYVIGGEYELSSDTVYSNKTECYDAITNTWETKANFSMSLSQISGCAIEDKIYVIGGYGGSGYETRHFCYDTKNDSWSSKTTAPGSSNDADVVAVNGLMYAICGHVYDTNNRAYDPLTDTWTTKTAIPVGRSKMATTDLGDNIYVCGGYYSGIINRIDCYSTTLNTWTLLSSEYYGYQSAATSLNGIIYLLAGMAGECKASYAFDPASKTLTQIADISAGTVDPVAEAYNGNVYLIGGIMSTSNRNNNFCYIPE